MATYENSHFRFSWPAVGTKSKPTIGEAHMARITHKTDQVDTPSLETSIRVFSGTEKHRRFPNEFVYVSSLSDVKELKLPVGSIFITIEVDCPKCQVCF